MNSNKLELGSGDNIFFSISAKSTTFEVSSLGLEFQISVSDFLMKSRSRRFNEVSVSKVTVSTTSLFIGLQYSVSGVLGYLKLGFLLFFAVFCCK